MGASGAMFASAFAVQGISSIGNAYSQSQALKANATYQRNLSNINKNFAELAYDETIRRGGTDAAIVDKNVRRTIGSQRASLAAQGIDVGTGSAQEIIRDTQRRGSVDAITVKNNALREAWGYKVSAIEQTAKGEFIDITARSAIRNTLVTGGIDALSSGIKSYASYKS